MSRPNATPQFTLIQGLYWMAYCILVSFSSVYLLDWWGSGALLAFATVTGGAGMLLLLWCLRTKKNDVP